MVFIKIQKDIEAIMRAVSEANERLIEETKSTMKAMFIKAPNVHVKALELMNQIGVIDTRLIRPLATLLVLQNKSQFWLYGDTGGDNWKDKILNGRETTKKDQKLASKKSGKFFNSKRDIPKIITECNFDTIDSTDAKLI